MKYIFLIVLILSAQFVSIFVGADEKRPPADSELVPVAVSEDGTLTLLTNKRYDGLAIVDNETGKKQIITDSRNAGYYPQISPDNRYVSYKGFRGEGKTIQQSPKLYDISENQRIQLADWKKICGTPAVASDGTIAYTLDNILIILDSDFTVKKEFDLGQHVNILTFTPDSDTVFFNPVPHQLASLEISTGSQEILLEKGFDFYNPVFSPDAEHILVQGSDGRVLKMETSTRSVEYLGHGRNPGWIDERTVGFVHYDFKEKEIVGTNLVVVDIETKERKSFFLGDKHLPSVIYRNNILYHSRGSLFNLKMENDMSLSPRQIPLEEVPETDHLKNISPRNDILYEPRSATSLSGVPQIHQVYDTPADFNGHAACGATSALIALQYYDILPSRDPAGWYVSEQYTYNNVTYDQWTNDPNGNRSYGGYGYIAQDTEWYGTPDRGDEHTSYWMREYFVNHDLESAVDWSTSWNTLTSEINNEYPFVLLFSNRLTGGHYITTVGYVEDQYTALFNDPYGDQNTPNWPSNDGKEVAYDWPGYNYGNENLDNVHLFVYARDTYSSSEEYSSGDWVKTTADPTLNLRAGPGTDYDILDGLSYQTLAVIIEHEDNGIYRTNNHWWKVRVEESNKEGWLAEYFLETADSPCRVSTPYQPDGTSSGNINQTLSFSTGGAECECGAGVEYRFDWDDGTYSGWSTSASAGTSWSSGGVYEIRVRARCLEDNSVESDWSAVKEVAIYTPPQADFEVDRMVVEPGSTVQFTDISSGDIDEYAWEFGDGGTSSSASPSHHFEETGSYTVSLQVHGPGGSDSMTRQDYMHVVESIPQYSAHVVSYDIPSVMKVNQTYELKVTLRNMGSETWEKDDNIYLGAVGDQDDLTGPGNYRAGLEKEVFPGDKHVFYVQLNPEEPGLFLTEWRMLKEGYSWFGETLSEEVQVDEKTAIDSSCWHLFK